MSVGELGVGALAVAALAIVLVIALRLVKRDPRWRRIRVGMFVERERFHDEDD